MTAISKMTMIGLLLTLLVAISSAQPAPKAQSHACTVATLKGSYGFYRNGTKNGQPLAAFGIVVFDGQGNSSFRQTTRVDGETNSDFFTSGPTDATYEIHRDCAAKFIDSTGFVFGEAVAVDGGNELYFLSLTDGATVMGVMKKLH